MLNKEAIKELKQESAIENAEKVIENALRSDGLAALPHDFEVRDIEKHMPKKRRFRGSFDTGLINDFAAYSKTHNSKESALFLSKDDMAAKAIFDLGDKEQPMHGDHSARLKLDMSADFKALKSVCDRSPKQKEFAEFIEDFTSSIVFLNADGKELQPQSVLAAIRSVTVEAFRQASSSEQDFRSEKTALESIAISDADNLPKYIKFQCTPYHSLSEREITCRVSVLTGENLKFSVSIINEESLKEVIASEFMQAVNDEFYECKIDMPKYIGTFSLD